MGLGKGGIVILASYKFPFIRVHDNLVQDPSNKAIISIGIIRINMQVCCFIILAMIIKMLIEQ